MYLFYKASTVLSFHITPQMTLNFSFLSLYSPIIPISSPYPFDPLAATFSPILFPFPGEGHLFPISSPVPTDYNLVIMNLTANNYT